MNRVKRLGLGLVAGVFAASIATTSVGIAVSASQSHSGASTSTTKNLANVWGN